MGTPGGGSSPSNQKQTIGNRSESAKNQTEGRLRSAEVEERGDQERNKTSCRQGGCLSRVVETPSLQIQSRS